MKHPLRGECQCGHVQYSISGPFIAQVACHCTQCQKFSATAFGVSALVAKEHFELNSGELKLFLRIADSGNRNECYFCPHCGNRIYHVNPNNADVLRLKPGTLAVTETINPTEHYWVKQKQAWVVIPEGVTCYETQPPM